MTALLISKAESGKVLPHNLSKFWIVLWQNPESETVLDIQQPFPVFQNTLASFFKIEIRCRSTVIEIHFICNLLIFKV